MTTQVIKSQLSCPLTKSSRLCKYINFGYGIPDFSHSVWRPDVGSTVITFTINHYYAPTSSPKDMV